MSKSNEIETALLNLIFNNTAVPFIGDASGLQPSGVAGSLYVSLHTSDPGESGEQTSNETSYTSYARVAVARNAGGWTVAGNQVTNTAIVSFPTCTGGTATITHFGVGTDVSGGAGTLLYSGALTAPLPVSNGITPQAAIGALVITED